MGMAPAELQPRENNKGPNGPLASVPASGAGAAAGTWLPPIGSSDPALIEPVGFRQRKPGPSRSPEAPALKRFPQEPVCYVLPYPLATLRAFGRAGALHSPEGKVSGTPACSGAMPGSAVTGPVRSNQA